MAKLFEAGKVGVKPDWLQTLQNGGTFHIPKPVVEKPKPSIHPAVAKLLTVLEPKPDGIRFMTTPSIRYFDGRGANKVWLSEIPYCLLYRTHQ